MMEELKEFVWIEKPVEVRTRLQALIQSVNGDLWGEGYFNALFPLPGLCDATPAFLV